MNAINVLKASILTEKSNLQAAELGKYTFEVSLNATKGAIKQAIEKTFKVAVTSVNVAHQVGKNKRSRTGRPSKTSAFKKAIVTLKAGDKIELI